MSVLLDTSVVQELIRKAPDPVVASWVSDRPLEDLFLSSVGEAELRNGVAILPPGRHRRTLLANLEGMLREAFGNRVLPFDRAAAGEYADIVAARRAAGRSIAPADCQIAGIARSRGLAVATRHVDDFEDMALEVVDPWSST